MFDTILVPTDGSDAAETAMEIALTLAQRFDASIHAISVVDLGEVPADVESEASEELVPAGEAALQTFEDRGAAVAIATTTAVIDTTEPVHRAIIEYAEDHEVGLIVMATQGRTGLDRLVLGTVADRTLRVSPVPVLTVHEDSVLDPEFETILVPTDGSDAANTAADTAIALAAVTDAALHVIHVVDLTTVSAEYGTAGVLDALEDAGQHAVDSVLDRANDASLRSVQASVISGSPARSILDYAEDREIDLVVMGTLGRTGLERYLLGSVTEKLVRHSKVPVLTVSMHEQR